MRQIVSTHPTRSLQFLEKLNTTQENTAAPPLQALVKLRIIVVGAGLGGLACAIALARRGHQVVVLEQAVELSEVRLYSIFLITNYSD
jgi:salicylate hydroxylase